MKNLRWVLHNAELPFAVPALIKAFQSTLGSEQLQAVASGSPNLVVRIFSFSYHIGLPKDDTGHGGGFVFDARSIPNPGREDRFRALTGKDRGYRDRCGAPEACRALPRHIRAVLPLRRERRREILPYVGIVSVPPFGNLGFRYRKFH